MSSAPPRIVELVETFDRNVETYHSQQYNETQLRREFIDPFFEELGWDVSNKQGYAQAYKEVIHEDAVKVGTATKVRWVLILLVLTVLTSTGAQKLMGTEPNEGMSGKNGKIPVILDTDICDDIDDTWALAMLLQSPEFDIKLITTAVGDTKAKTKVVAKILQTASRTDIPIGTGIAVGDMKNGHRQDGWVKDFDLSKYAGRIHPDGVQAMVDTIMNSPEPITLITIGPLPNVAAALEREPNIARKARFVGMHGSVHRGYGGKSQIDKEYNVVSFIKAAQKVFTAEWDMTITPLDTCSLVVLQRDRYQKVLGSANPAAKAVIENYRVWAKSGDVNEAQVSVKSTTLFDTVAIYLAMRSDLLEMENLGIRVTDDGRTVIDEKAKKITCALKWKNLDAFGDLLVERLTSPVVTTDAIKQK
jgi:inosine-uridine nucleoside N-ribohydrolase